MIPGETILILLGAISGAMPLANASTAPPTDEMAICPGLHFLAGEPPVSYTHLRAHET